MPNNTKNSFEPRIGIVQLVFGIIYAFVTGIAIVLAYYVWDTSVQAGTPQQPWMQYFFIVLFAVMAAKSFFMYARIKILLNNGIHTVGTVDSIEPVRGITIVRGRIDVKDYGEIEIESRYAGESVAHELKHFLEDEHTSKLPALVVQGKSPRGMFVIKTYAGHLDQNSLNSLKVNQK